MEKNKGKSRQKILETAADLFKSQGYHATGLNQIIKESGAPKGSIYHYFPGGKEELAIESIKLAVQKVKDGLMDNLSQSSDPLKSIEELLKKMADEFDPHNPYHGLSISMLAMETSLISEPLRNACLEAFKTWEKIFYNKLIEGGFSPEDAEDLGMTIHFLLEGAVTLSLVRQDNKPFLIVSRQISKLLKRHT